MPQSWQTHWPLGDSSKGLSDTELYLTKENDLGAIATRERNLALQTIGNLTLLEHRTIS